MGDIEEALRDQAKRTFHEWADDCLETRAADFISDLISVVSRLAEGERSDEGHTALRDAAVLALSKAQTPPNSVKE